ncbi:U-box domain-containing protein 28-like [Cornus florida]|uniref:U-box domain-containing protein 28-like n=1 Tax=Cornus florida TaxID=4283 RepID=UPI0028973DBF|nr:U-box domain-containing protein 28-like [Cornus florida]
MVKEDMDITLPSFFRCPISLDVMKSPVTLHTGVTYDRSSIQRWLDDGKNTCPATMQLLHTTDLVHNHTLGRLIRIWSDSIRTRSGSDSSDPDSPANSPPPKLTQHQARDLINQLHSNESISKLASFATDSDENRRFLAAIDGFPLLLVGIIGGNVSKEFNSAEEAIRVLSMILEEYRDREQLAKSMIDKEYLSSMLILLKKGRLGSRIATARVLESIAIDAESKLFIAEHSDVIPELLKLASSESDPNAIESGLSSLICLSIPKRIRRRLIRLGIVPKLGKMLSDSNLSVSSTEKALKMLEMASACREGRDQMCEDEVCVSAIVKKVLKVSSSATEHAVMILWSLCYLFGDQKAMEAVAKSNGLTNILLLMQSNCSPAVRRMSGDLLKMFRVNLKCCISSYDTETTHIMPF